MKGVPSSERESRWRIWHFDRAPHMLYAGSRKEKALHPKGGTILWRKPIT